MSCNVDLTSKENRIFVIEEKRLDDKNIFFWFRGTGQITHEGLSYFQIAKDKCDLSFQEADAYCNEPIQLYDIMEDSISILTMSEIVPIKVNAKYKIIAIEYSIEIYEPGKRPNKEQQYFLDSMCK